MLPGAGSRTPRQRQQQQPRTSARLSATPALARRRESPRHRPGAPIRPQSALPCPPPQQMRQRRRRGGLAQHTRSRLRTAAAAAAAAAAVAPQIGKRPSETLTAATAVAPPTPGPADNGNKHRRRGRDTTVAMAGATRSRSERLLQCYHQLRHRRHRFTRGLPRAWRGDPGGGGRIKDESRRISGGAGGRS